MTAHQQGAADFHANGWTPHKNPHSIGSADYASWRNGHTAAQVQASRDRAGTRQIGDHLPHGWEKRS